MSTGNQAARRKRRAEAFRALDRRMREVHFGQGPPVACAKLCYGSKSEARSAMRATIGSGTTREKELLNVYFCPKCDAWHIGHDRQASA